MSIISYILVKAGLSERRKDERIPFRGLDAFYWTILGEKRAKIKDISATGLFLLTAERWPPGTIVLLTLRGRGLLEREARSQVRLRVRCVRLGDDGVGLTFVEEPSTAEIWSRSMAVATELFPGSHAIRLFRASAAIAFLLRISPSLEAPLVSLVSGFGRHRAEHLIEIALRAEELLGPSERDPQSTVSSDLFLRILDEASKTSQEEVQRCWAGLLASCLQPADDESLGHVVLMSKLDRDHVAILTAGCTRAMRIGWEPEFVFSSPLHCSSDEIRTITGIRNLVAIEGNLNHLHHLGLLEKTVKPLGCEQLEQVNITPTGLGLKLFIRWNGQHELPRARDFAAPDCAALELAS